jgi:ketosteroid isomerase-like protein
MTTPSTTTTTGTAGVITEFLGRFGAGDRPAILELFAPQVDFLVAGAPTVPWTGRRATLAEIDDFLMHVLDDVETQRFDIETVVVEGDTGVVLGAFAHRILSTGKVFTGPFALRITVVEGTIRAYHMLEDSFAAAVAFTPA